MKASYVIRTVTVVSLFVASTCALAWELLPVENVSPAWHGNLASAQAQIRAAYRDVDAAQRANHGDLAGHAERAKQLLDAASTEIKAAAETANVR